MLTILIGRAKTGKSDQVLRRMAELGERSRQILLFTCHRREGDYLRDRAHVISLN